MSAIVNTCNVVKVQNRTGCSLTRPAVTRRGAPACERPAVTRASDRQVGSSGEDRIVEQTRTYDESKGKIYSKASPPEDDEGSIALLVPGGRVSDRPSQEGGAAAAARREQSKLLKINTDLRLYRARQKGIQTKLLPSSNEKLRKSQQVEQDLRSVLSRDSTDERTYVILGTFLLRQRRIDEARAVYEEGCTVAQGKNAFIWTAMANLERKDGNYGPARKFYQAAVTADARHAAAYHGWGELEKRAGRLDAARNVLLQGIRQTTEHPSPHLFVSLANLAIRTGLVGEARYWLREGTNTQAGAKSNALWTTWGNLEWKQAGDPDAAAYCFDMALRVHKASRYAHLSYAMMEKATGNLRHARELLKRGAEQNPTDAPLRQAYGVMLAEEREYNAARAQFRAAAKADEYHLPVWQAWAVMECSLKNYEQARRLFQRGVWAAPKDLNLVWLWQAWGCMEAELGNLSQARSLFKAGVGLAPDNDACWEAWIRMEEDNDLLDRANVLRSHRFETAERDALPESFTTLPSDGGAVMGTVKKWMQRFMQSEGPSTVYTPPPGTARQAEDSGSNPSTAGATALARGVDGRMRRRRRKKIVVERTEPQGADSDTRSDADAATMSASSEGGSAVWPADASDAATVSAGRSGGAGPEASGGLSAAAGRGADAVVLGGSESRVAGNAAGTAAERQQGAAEGGDAQAAGTAVGPRKPMRRASKTVSGRIARPRWRRPEEKEENSGGTQDEAQRSSTAETRANGGWAGQWNAGGEAEAGMFSDLGIPEVELSMDEDGLNGSRAVGNSEGGNGEGKNGSQRTISAADDRDSQTAVR